MAVENTPRRAGPFVSNGSSTAYAFSFRVFEPDDVEVIVSSSADENAPDATLVYQADYTVSINGDQENNPGGTVTLNKAPAQGIRVTLLSQVEATQDVQLTNHGGFSPKILNTVHDKLTILIQQLKEQADRTLVVPATSEKTPEALFDEILNVASNANQFAQQAQQVYQEVVRLFDEIKDIRETTAESLAQEGAVQIDLVKEEGSAQVASIVSAGATQLNAVVSAGQEQITGIVNEGDIQAERLQNISDFEESGHGVRCQEFATVLTQDYAENSNVPLPAGFSYVVGRNHLHISVNGIDLMKPQNFEEVGSIDTNSAIVKIKMPLVTGDEVKLWTVPLGRGLTDDLIERIKTLEDSLADLSRSVVYKE